MAYLAVSGFDSVMTPLVSGLSTKAIQFLGFVVALCRDKCKTRCSKD